MPSPSSLPVSPFVFAACRAGSEAALKADVARRHAGQLTPAFMRPQLITWKSKEALPASFELGSPLARVSGFSIGSFASVTELAQKLQEQNLREIAIEVAPREISEDGVIDWSGPEAVQTALHAAVSAAGLTLINAPQAGDAVLSVLVDASGAKPLFAGLHSHRVGLSTQLPRLVLPAHAPSRAWLKLEQALAWRGWDAEELRGLTALDLGCAPGGASLALLDRGVRVLGVDTGDMDESVLRHDSGGFRQLRVPLARLDIEKLPAHVDLILCDINLAPPEVLPHVARLQAALRAQRLILTLKMNSDAHERRMDEYLKFIRGFAPAPVHATQLAANRREICVTAG
ncbi:MAG: hypothetical protein IPK32_25695 [Verrucomicrobiaceae bacterium]|nr:hypothetical protein [Verrucomicrobiaceae bacterium]